jgi:hypothetical protein
MAVMEPNPSKSSRGSSSSTGFYTPLLPGAFYTKLLAASTLELLALFF